MEQNFDLLAQSRANYYTKGSPVQFVRVELLKGDVTGEVAVCLTFKNISQEVLSDLVINFKCKNAAGEVVCEAPYHYESLNVNQGELFGQDDAVYVASGSVGSVDVELKSAEFASGESLSLEQFKRVRLPVPKALPPELARRLKQKVGSEADLKVAPQMTEYGWYCACGAFHPIEENCVWCSECGSDRILMQYALSTLLQQGHTTEEPTRMVTSIKDESPTRVVTDLTEQDRAAITGRVEEDDGDMRIAQPGRRTTATLPPEEVEDVWNHSSLKKLTSRTVVDLTEMQDQLAEVRANGYAIDDEENEMGVRCVAVAIPGPDGRAESAFSISGLAPYMTPERIRRVAALALDTRTDILADLGVGRKG